MSQTSKHFTPAQKADIVRRHLSGKEPVSDLADKFGVQPSQIHNWVRHVLEQAESAFQVGPGRPANIDHVKYRKIEQLEAKLAHKNEVIAELMKEHVKLKEGLGNSKRSLGSPRHPRQDCRLCKSLDETRRTACTATP